MGWRFYGYAAVFSFPDKDGDVFLPGCFSEFLASRDHLGIPMLNGHDRDERVGRWQEMRQDNFGLFVVGELHDNLAALDPPFPGLSIRPVRSRGPPEGNIWGGRDCRTTWIEEISLVAQASHPSARILGPR